MIEVQSQAPQHEKLPSVEGNVEAQKQHMEALKQRAEADSEAQADDETLEAIKKDIEQTAVSKEDFNQSESSADAAPASTYVSEELKAMGGRRVLTNVRMHMRRPARVFSKAIHQPVVERISEAAAPTIARPSGILGGGIAALVGSGTLLYITKHYGYRYNYLVFIILFVGGFIAGMAIELLVRAVFRRNRSA